MAKQIQKECQEKNKSKEGTEMNNNHQKLTGFFHLKSSFFHLFFFLVPIQQKS